MFEATDESTFLLGIEKSSIPKGWKQATVEDNKRSTQILQNLWGFREGVNTLFLISKAMVILTLECAWKVP